MLVLFCTYHPLLKETSYCTKTPSINNEHLHTTGHAKNTHLIRKRVASAPYLYVCLPSVKETSYFKENPIETFPQQCTPAHSWHRDKHENQNTKGKRQLSNLPI